jgi:hypothetical protein
MLKLTVAVVAIGLADCVNPSLIGGELFVATGEHPRRGTTAFAVAALMVTFAFGLALALGLGDLILSLVPKPGSTLKYALIAFAGIVLIVGGAVVWIRRKALVSTKQSADRAEPHGPAALMGAGIAGLLPRRTARREDFGGAHQASSISAAQLVLEIGQRSTCIDNEGLATSSREHAVMPLASGTSRRMATPTHAFVPARGFAR